MAGTITLIVALLIAAMIFFFLEIITPTFGVLAVMGLAALGGAIWMGFTVSQALGIAMIVVSIFLVPAYCVVVVKLLPRSPLGKRLFLGKAGDASGAATPEAPEHERLVGRTGVAETPLRPTGAVRIGGKRVIASAESGMIEKGATVKVIKSADMNVIVCKVKENS